MRRILFLSLITFSFIQPKCQTQIGFRMPEDFNRVDIPFQEINNLIVIPIVINDFLKLQFILDTGVETTILAEPAFAPLLDIEFSRKITISGAGINDAISAYVANHITFELPGGVIGKNMNILVLEDNFLRLSERMGTDVHGIIGNDIFNHFVVEINYDGKMITLYRQERFKPRKRSTGIPLEIIDSKPYLLANVQESGETVRLMVDSGASHALLLDPEQSNIRMPTKTIETRLGTGLGGEIIGDLGRLSSLSIDHFEFYHVLVSIPQRDAYSRLIKRGSRRGTIGGEILSRLNPIFDYKNEMMYASKARYYKKDFEADMCGIDLIVKGRFLDSLFIDYVRKNSPADKAGLQAGDLILSLSGHNLYLSTFPKMQAMLKGIPNKKLRFRVLRDGEKIKFHVRLKRQI